MFTRSILLTLAFLTLLATPTRAADHAREDCEQDFDRDRSIAVCTQVLARGGAESSQNRAIAYSIRGIAYNHKGDYDRAIRDFDEAIRLDPEYASTAYHNRGLTNDSKGDHDSTIRDYDEAIRLNPSDDAARAVREEALRALAQARSKPQPPVPAPLSETRVALIIGNARYAAQSPLKNPGNDAAAVAAALRGAGFQKVMGFADLTRDGFVKALQEFQDEADRADWVVIYFSGHGVEIGGKNYTVPTDARLQTDRNTPDEAISLDRLMDSVGGARKLRMVILDACRNNPYLASMQRTIADRSVGKGLAPIEPDFATLVVYEAKGGQLAQDSDGENSPFAAALVKHLGEPRVEVSTRPAIASSLSFTVRCPGGGFCFRP